jgi:hypothetical protein
LSKAIKTDEANPDEKIFGLLFAGNIHRDINLDITSKEHIVPLVQQVEHWQNDLKTYLSIINNCLLRDQE